MKDKVVVLRIYWVSKYHGP